MSFASLARERLKEVLFKIKSVRSFRMHLMLASYRADVPEIEGLLELNELKPPPSLYLCKVKKKNSQGQALSLERL